MWLTANGLHRDVRGWRFTGTPDPAKPFGLSLSEIVATLRGSMHTARPYPMEQLIADLEALTPARLDAHGGTHRPIASAPENKRVLIFGKMPEGHDEMAMAWKDRLDGNWYYAPQGGVVRFTPTMWCDVPEPATMAAEPLVDRLIQASAGACSCIATSPEPRWHDPLCHFRLLSESIEAIARTD